MATCYVKYKVNNTSSGINLQLQGGTESEAIAKIKKIFILGLLILSNLIFRPTVSAQLFDNTYGTSADESGRKVILTSDGGYAILQSVSNNSKIIKTDNQGNVIWEKLCDYGTVMNDLIQTSDGGYAIIGYCTNSAYKGNKYSVGLFVKLDANANYLWHKSLYGNSLENGGGALILENNSGDFIITMTYQGHPDFGGINYQPAITKLSSSGVLIWTKAINNSGGNIGGSIIESGAYVICGKNNAVYGASLYGGNSFVAKYDDSGSQVWKKDFVEAPISNGNGDGFSSICKLISGEFIVQQRTKISNNWTTSILKLSATGNKIWMKSYMDSIVFNDFKATDDGNFLALGTSNINSKDLFIYKVNATDGSIIWSSYFGGSSQDLASNMLNLSSEDIVICGTTSSKGSGGNDAWLFKVSKDGSLCNIQPSITPQSNTSFCQGGSVILEAITGNYTYQWYNNGNTINGETNQTYTATTSGNYSVKVIDGSCDATSSATTVTVNANPTVSFSIPSFINNENGSYVLNGSPSGGTYTRNGITSNDLDLSTVGLGKQTIVYDYIDNNGCLGSKSASTIIYDTTGNVCSTYDTTFVTIDVYDTTYVTQTIYDTITIENHVSVTDTLIIDVSLAGLNSPNNINTMKVYPNPSNDVVNIDNGDYALMNGYSIKIINSLGQEKFSSSINIPAFQIPVSQLDATGVYYINIYDNQSQLVESKVLVLE